MELNTKRKVVKMIDTGVWLNVTSTDHVIQLGLCAWSLIWPIQNDAKMI